jgi:predicted aspartyl protease/peptidoglycan hydrolase-like protein with peptidoglycan-binding domain
MVMGQKRFFIVCVTTLALCSTVSAQNANNFIQLFGGMMQQAARQAALAEWQRLPQPETLCMDNALRRIGYSVGVMIQHGVMPNDPRISSVRLACRATIASTPSAGPDIQNLSSKPTFDCANARSLTARTVCFDQAGPAADWDLTSAHWARYFTLNEPERQAFDRAEQSWLDGLNQTCLKAGNPQQCVLSAYHKRANSYRRQLSDEAVAESRLTPEQHLQIQQSLVTMGFLNDTPDGEFGPNTRAAIRRFKEQYGNVETDFLTAHERSELLQGNVAPEDAAIAEQRRLTKADFDSDMQQYAEWLPYGTHYTHAGDLARLKEQYESASKSQGPEVEKLRAQFKEQLALAESFKAKLVAQSDDLSSLETKVSGLLQRLTQEPLSKLVDADVPTIAAKLEGDITQLRQMPPANRGDVGDQIADLRNRVAGIESKIRPAQDEIDRIKSQISELGRLADKVAEGIARVKANDELEEFVGDDPLNHAGRLLAQVAEVRSLEFTALKEREETLKLARNDLQTVLASISSGQEKYNTAKSLADRLDIFLQKVDPLLDFFDQSEVRSWLSKDGRSSLNQLATYRKSLSPLLKVKLIDRGDYTVNLTAAEATLEAVGKLRREIEAAIQLDQELKTVHEKIEQVGRDSVDADTYSKLASVESIFNGIRKSGVPVSEAQISFAQDNVQTLREEIGAAILVPLESENGTYVVPVLINNAITLKFVVDSGASDVTIPADVVMTLIRTGTLQRSDFVGSTIYQLADGSTVPSETFMLRSLTVGNKVIQNVKAGVAPVKGSLLLGQSFLSRFKSWSLDNGKQVLVLKR